MNQKTIKEYIRALEHMTDFFKKTLENISVMPPEPQTEKEKIKEITDIRFLIKSNNWPLAVPEDSICGEDEDRKLGRAATIIEDVIKTDKKNKKILDFGCGEGHVAYVTKTLTSADLVVGYDIKPHKWEFDKTNNLTFTSDWEEVKKSGKYDIVLIYDVFDHLKNQEITLQQIKEVKSEKGKIFLRCHPWTSRHGTHIYNQLNKAYLHLILNENELSSMGLKEEYTQKTLDPLNHYRLLIHKAGLTIEKENIINQSMELFFTNETQLLRRIKSQWKEKNELPKEILEIQFVDYTLV